VTKAGDKGPGKATPARPRSTAPVPVTGRASGRKVHGEVLPPEDAPAAAPVKRGGKARSKPAKAPAKAKRASTHRVGRGGDGEHVPTERDRQIVEAMASYGIPEPAIAALIGAEGVSEPTLRKHYRRELDTAQDKLTAKLNESIVAQALGHPVLYDEQGRVVRAEQKRYFPAAAWLLKRQDYLEDRRLEREAMAQRAAQQALRDRLKLVFEHATADEIEVLQRVFGRVAEQLAQAALPGQV
jgi:hypothetical protein